MCWLNPHIFALIFAMYPGQVSLILPPKAIESCDERPGGCLVHRRVNEYVSPALLQNWTRLIRGELMAVTIDLWCVFFSIYRWYLYIYIHPYIHRFIQNSFIHFFIFCHLFISSFIHSFIRTYIHTYMHACMHAYMHAYMHTYIHTYIHACIHTYIHTYTHTCILHLHKICLDMYYLQCSSYIHTYCVLVNLIPSRIYHNIVYINVYNNHLCI